MRDVSCPPQVIAGNGPADAEVWCCLWNQDVDCERWSGNVPDVMAREIGRAKERDTLGQNYEQCGTQETHKNVSIKR